MLHWSTEIYENFMCVCLCRFQSESVWRLIFIFVIGTKWNCIFFCCHAFSSDAWLTLRTVCFLFVYIRVWCASKANLCEKKIGKKWRFQIDGKMHCFGEMNWTKNQKRNWISNVVRKFTYIWDRQTLICVGTIKTCLIEYIETAANWRFIIIDLGGLVYGQCRLQ